MLAFISNHTTYTPSVWDTVVVVLLESACGLFILLTVFWMPLSDWLQRRRIRKELQYRERYSSANRPRSERRYEPVGKSRRHRSSVPIRRLLGLSSVARITVANAFSMNSIKLSALVLYSIP